MLSDTELTTDSIKSITDLKMFKKEVKCDLKCTTEEFEQSIISY